MHCLHLYIGDLQIDRIPFNTKYVKLLLRFDNHHHLHGDDDNSSNDDSGDSNDRSIKYNDEMIISDNFLYDNIIRFNQNVQYRIKLKHNHHHDRDDGGGGSRDDDDNDYYNNAADTATSSSNKIKTIKINTKNSFIELHLYLLSVITHDHNDNNNDDNIKSTTTTTTNINSNSNINSDINNISNNKTEIVLGSTILHCMLTDQKSITKSLFFLDNYGVLIGKLPITYFYYDSVLKLNYNNNSSSCIDASSYSNNNQYHYSDSDDNDNVNDYKLLDDYKSYNNHNNNKHKLKSQLLSSSSSLLKGRRTKKDSIHNNNNINNTEYSFLFNRKLRNSIHPKPVTFKQDIDFQLNKEIIKKLENSPVFMRNYNDIDNYINDNDDDDDDDDDDNINYDGNYSVVLRESSFDDDNLKDKIDNVVVDDDGDEDDDDIVDIIYDWNDNVNNQSRKVKIKHLQNNNNNSCLDRISSSSISSGAYNNRGTSSSSRSSKSNNISNSNSNSIMMKEMIKKKKKKKLIKNNDTITNSSSSSSSNISNLHNYNQYVKNNSMTYSPSSPYSYLNTSNKKYNSTTTTNIYGNIHHTLQSPRNKRSQQHQSSLSAAAGTAAAGIKTTSPKLRTTIMSVGYVKNQWPDNNNYYNHHHHNNYNIIDMEKKAYQNQYIQDMKIKMLEDLTKDIKIKNNLLLKHRKEQLLHQNQQKILKQKQIQQMLLHNNKLYNHICQCQ